MASTLETTSCTALPKTFTRRPLDYTICDCEEDKANPNWVDSYAACSAPSVEGGSGSVSLNHLSSGGLILGVGLGDSADAEFTSFEKNKEDRIRAAKLEGLDILVGLWRGERFSCSWKYYEVRNVQFLPLAYDHLGFRFG